jgi:hypothetical protein
MVMNQGKRHIRYTLIAMVGLVVLMVGAARIYASTVNADTPQWLRGVMSLGMAMKLRGTIPSAASSTATAPPVATLADLRNFTKVSVEGDFSVEVIGAPDYKVGLTGASADKWTLDWDLEEDGLVRIKGGEGTEGGVLRIETPTLVSVEATGLRQLTVRGVTAPELNIRMKDLAGVLLEDCEVGNWILHSTTLVEVQAQKLSSSAGYSIQASGQLTIHGPGASKMNIRGGSGKIIVQGKK